MDNPSEQPGSILLNVPDVRTFPDLPSSLRGRGVNTPRFLVSNSVAHFAPGKELTLLFHMRNLRTRAALMQATEGTSYRAMRRSPSVALPRASLSPSQEAFSSLLRGGPRAGVQIWRALGRLPGSLADLTDWHHLSCLPWGQSFLGIALQRAGTVGVSLRAGHAGALHPLFRGSEVCCEPHPGSLALCRILNWI